MIWSPLRRQIPASRSTSLRPGSHREHEPLQPAIPSDLRHIAARLAPIEPPSRHLDPKSPGASLPGTYHHETRRFPSSAHPTGATIARQLAARTGGSALRPGRDQLHSVRRSVSSMRSWCAQVSIIYGIRGRVGNESPTAQPAMAWQGARLPGRPRTVTVGDGLVGRHPRPGHAERPI